MKKILFAAVALLLFFGANPDCAFAYSADPAKPEAWAQDTIAGFSTTIKTSRAFPDKEIFINVERPDGSKLVFDKTTDKNGYAEMNLDNLHTKKAGIYALNVILKENDASGKINTFKVYPDHVSPSRSNVLVDKQTLRANGKDSAILNAVLTDKFGNPIANHQVNVISSRSSDNIEALSGRDYTDKNGSVFFKVNSASAGISVYSVYDAMSKVVLDKRISILYSGGSSAFGIGGNDYMFANVFGADNFSDNLTAQAAGPIYMFKFEDTPSELNKNTVASFTLNAVDSKGATVANYTGAVHFSVEGSNSGDAVLPEDYTFSANDMGKHTFSKALTFKKPGVYKIQAADIKNTDIKGEIEISVTDSSVPQPSDSLVSITNPVAGKYSVNMQIVSGTSLPGSNVKIFDNNEEIGTVSANSNGDFSFTTPPLSDGTHVIYVAAVSDKGVILGISNKVMIEIDTTPAAVDSINLLPDKDISMGSPVVITVVTEPNMTKVAVVIGGADIIELQAIEGMPGTYKGSFQAPAKAGKYNIDILLTDSLGNEESYQNQKSFNVTDVSAIKPSDVIGLKAFPGNKKITLTWSPSTDYKGISRYRVYFGTDPKSMINYVDTRDSSTTWYVPNLTNETKYFFALKAINKDGNDSTNFSAVVNAAPSETASAEPFSAPLYDESLLDEALFEDEEISETGPAAVVVFGLSGAASLISMVLRRRFRRSR